MTVAEYIVKTLEGYGIKHCFTIIGGGSLWLNEAFGKSEQIECVYMHNEQQITYAMEGYSRSNNYELAVGCVTTGPGGLNALSGVMGMWTDSVSGLIISGQVDSRTINHNSKLRQLGDQEVDIISVVKPITKYAVEIYDPQEIKIELPKAIDIAMAHRRGPVWISVPWDVQKGEINA